MTYNPDYIPFGVNNKDNPYYQTFNNSHIARELETRAMFLGTDPSTQFDASALTLSTSFSGSQVVAPYYGGIAAQAEQPLVLVMRQVTFGDPIADACLTEMGSRDGLGAAVFYLGAAGFVVSAGIASGDVGDVGRVAFIYDLTGNGYAGTTYDVAVEYNPAGGSVKLWLGDTFITEDTAGPAYTGWTDADNGGYLQTDGGSASERVNGCPSTPWPENAGDLEVYFNQTVT